MIEAPIVRRPEQNDETRPTFERIARVFNIRRNEKGIEHKHYTATEILINAGIKDPTKTQAKFVNEHMKKYGFIQMSYLGKRGFWLEKWPLTPKKRGK